MKQLCEYCKKEIPLERIDSLGRKLTKKARFCNNNQKCRNAFYRDKNRETYKKYMRDYYINKLRRNNAESI
jgi:hypothetical protein